MKEDLFQKTVELAAEHKDKGEDCVRERILDITSNWQVVTIQLGEREMDNDDQHPDLRYAYKSFTRKPDAKEEFKEKEYLVLFVREDRVRNVVRLILAMNPRCSFIQHRPSAKNIGFRSKAMLGTEWVKVEDIIKENVEKYLPNQNITL